MPRLFFTITLINFVFCYFFMLPSRANLFKTINRPQILERFANNSVEQPGEPPKPDEVMPSASKAIVKQEPLRLTRTPSLAKANLGETIARPDLSDQLRNKSMEQPRGRPRDPDFEISNFSTTFTGSDPPGRAEADSVPENVSKSIARQILHNHLANDSSGEHFRQVPRGRARVPLLTGLDDKIDENYVKGSIWPKPQFEYREDFFYFVDSVNFQFTTNSNGGFLRILKSAFQRYGKITFPKTVVEEMPYGLVLNNLDVVVENNRTSLDINMDERCKYL